MLKQIENDNFRYENEVNRFKCLLLVRNDTVILK